MEQKRALELCQNLQTVLQLPLSFCTMVNDDPLFVDALYQQLKQHQDQLEHALQSAFPDEEDLKKLIETGLNESFAKITDGTSYARRVSHTVDWAVTQGYLLELIAAARQRNQRNTLLRVFVVSTLKPLIEANMPPSVLAAEQTQPPLVPTQLPHLQTQPPENAPTSIYDQRPTTNGAGTNGHQQLPSHPVVEHSNTTTSGDSIAVAASEEEQEPASAQNPPTQLKPRSVENHLSFTDTITQAQQQIDEAREAVQLVQDMFQNNEEIVEGDVIQQVNEAKAKVETIPAQVAHIPIPDYPDLHLRLVCEQSYFCSEVRFIIVSLQTRKNQTASPSSQVSVEKRLSNLLQSLQEATNLMKEFIQQTYILEQTHEQQFETGT